MAIDTAEKRMNIPGIGRPWMRAHFPIAAPDVEWRAATGLGYGANGIDAPPAAGALPGIVGSGGLAGAGALVVGPGGLVA